VALRRERDEDDVHAYVAGEHAYPAMHKKKIGCLDSSLHQTTLSGHERSLERLVHVTSEVTQLITQITNILRENLLSLISSWFNIMVLQ
jgi:hypothetical protein